MTAQKKTVILHGELGRRFGAEHKFVISTPAEAVRALCANYREFKRDLIESGDNGVGYKIIVSDKPTSIEELHYPVAVHNTIEIVPVIMGAKKGGFGQILIGAALIAASFYLPVTPLFASAGAAAFSSISLSSIAFNMGLSLALGGVMSFLSKPPKAEGPSEAPENKPSYTFDGPVNTVSQGHPVPIGYGKLIVGSAVISAGITSENYNGAKDD